MPQAVAAALPYIIGTTATAALGTTGVLVLSYAITIAAMYAYGTYQASASRRAARENFNSSLKDRLVMTATADAPRTRCYGRVRNVDGILFKATHGSKNEYYTFVVAVAGHEIDGFEQFWFNDTPLTLNGTGYVLTKPFTKDKTITESIPLALTASGSVTLAHTPMAGSVSIVQVDTSGGSDGPVSSVIASSLSGLVVSWTGANPAAVGLALVYSWIDIEAESKARIRAYTGAPGQDLSGDLIALGISGVTAAHKFGGMACLLVTLQYDTDAFTSGVPSMTAIFRGAKCFDPRTGLTVWTENPAIIARDWALYEYGGAAQADEIDDALLIASANACDVAHTFEVGATATQPASSHPGPIYRCGVVAPTQTDPTATLQEIVSAMAGKYAWAGGKLKIKAGFYSPPVITIDETWLSSGSIETLSGVARAELVNLYRPTIADRQQGYVVAPTEPVRAEAFITSDGQELGRDLSLIAVTESWRAQHVAGVMLRELRQGLAVKLPCNMRAFVLELYDTVAIDLPRYGWDGKEFEVLAWEFSPTGGITLQLKETAAFIYDPDAGFDASDAAPNTNLPVPWFLQMPIGVGAESGSAALTDGSIITRTRVVWDASEDESVRNGGAVEVQYILATTNPIPTEGWPSVTEDGSATETTIAGLQTGRVYLFRVRFRSNLARSAWSPTIAHKIAAPPAAGGATYQSETAPSDPKDGDLWGKPSVGIIYRWNEALASWIQFGTIGADWTQVVGRPKLFRVGAAGFGVSAPVLGLFNGETGAALGGTIDRSYMLARIRRSDGVVVFTRQYDVFGFGAAGGFTAATLATDLNATANDHIAVVWTYDEPLAHRLDGGLPAAMYRCGASKAVFGSPAFQTRAAYVLIGIGGCGEGNGFEAYQGSIPSDPNAWVDVAFQVASGNLLVTGSGATPRSLVDYSYTGTLDATTDLALIATGNCVVAGNFASKIGGIDSWDSSVRSRDSFVSGGYVTWVVVDLTHDYMVGLNSDPATDDSYTSIDNAIYVRSAGDAEIYENGIMIQSLGGIAVGDVLGVLYDNSRISYIRNGNVLRTSASAAGRRLFMDSSFRNDGSAARNIRFGPMSPNDWASIGSINVVTNQLAPNAATEVVQDTNDFAGATVSSGTVRTVALSAGTDYGVTVEFTGNLVGSNIYPDAGNLVSWIVTRADASTFSIGDCTFVASSSGVTRAQYSFADSFVIPAGETWTARLEVSHAVSAPAITLNLSRARFTKVKR